MNNELTAIRANGTNVEAIRIKIQMGKISKQALPSQVNLFTCLYPGLHWHS